MRLHQFNFNWKKHNDAWEKFCEGNVKYIESDEYESLLEIILKDADYDKLNILAQTSVSIKEFWKDPSINYIPIEKKDITHCRRVIYNIERILFPKDQPHKEEDKIDCIYELLEDDVFVLLYSVYIHDYGKGQTRFIKHHISKIPSMKEFHNKIEAAASTNQFEPKQYDIFEKYHTLILYTFLGNLMSCDNYKDLSNKIKEIYDDADLISYCVYKGKEVSNAANAQQLLFKNLCELTEISRVGENNEFSFLKEIQLISCSHKAYQKLDCKGDFEDPIDYFETIKNYKIGRSIKKKLHLLAALLRIGDNLDFTISRLEDDANKDKMRNWFKNNCEQKLQEPWISLFAIWSKFELVERCDICHVRNDNRDELSIEIIIKYRRFSDWQKHFLTLRNIVEKDFRIPNYLRKLIQGKIRLQLLYEMIESKEDKKWEVKFGGQLNEFYSLKKKQNDANLKEVKKNLYCNHEKVNEFILQSIEYWKISKEDEPQSTLEFSTLPEEISLPTNTTLLYTLSYLENLGSTTHDNIVELFAVKPFEKTNKGDIEGGGVLKVIDEKNITISLVEDISKRAKIHEFLKEYRKQPILIRKKVQELEELGFLLPFSLKVEDRVLTGIDGFEKILNPQSLDNENNHGFEHTRNILVVGKPGTGKTTLLLQILQWNLLNQNRNILMLTFEENFSIIVKTIEKNFGWKNIDFIESISPQCDVSFSQDDKFCSSHIQQINKLIEEKRPDLLAIDGLSRLRSYLGYAFRNTVNMFFRTLQMKGITGIFSVEEPTDTDHNLAYESDGVIHLYRDAECRYLEIDKLRSQNFSPGRHAFEIISKDNHGNLEEKERFAFISGINVYPNEEYYATITDKANSNADTDKLVYIPTGVKNLNGLLPGVKEGEEGYREGNSILVMGSPGSGKTLFGLHFLMGDDIVQKVHGISNVLWLSFEGSKRYLVRGISTFDSSVGYSTLVNSDRFIFKFIPPALISIEKVLFYITKIIIEHKIKRIVIDSVSEIEHAFGNREANFRQYMTTLIHTLSRKDVTSMFLFRVAGFFRSVQESESELSTLVDTIISIKTFDMKNEIRRGLFILKSRGRKHISQLQTMEILPKEGISLSYKGWELEALLSGDTGSIHEPEIFLKLFYENPAEQDINKKIIEEFERRYPKKARFTEVRKPAIYSEFWSFRGDYGAGHSNIRMVSISMYMVEAFRELDRLHELDDFFPEKLKLQIEKDFRWKRYCTEKGKHDNMPLYTDIGFFVARKDLIKLLTEGYNDLKTLFKESGLFDRNLILNKEISWKKLKLLSTKIDNNRFNNSETKTQFYLFSLPYLYDQTEFMAFFFEILWSKGGDVYHFPIFKEQNGKKTQMAFYKEQILLNKAVWKCLKEMIENSIKSIDDSEGIYTSSDIIKSLNPLFEVLIKKYETTEDQSENTSISASIKLTELSFIMLKQEKEVIPESIIEQLENLEKRRNLDEEDFNISITKIIGKDQFEEYKPQIIKYSKRSLINHVNKLKNLRAELKKYTKDIIETEGKDKSEKEEEKKKIEKEFLFHFVNFLDQYVIEKLLAGKIDNNDVITINNKLAKEALTFLFELVNDSNSNIPNPYDGDFSGQSIFCRKWYSQIEDLRQKIKLDEPFWQDLAEIPEKIIQRLKRIDIQQYATEDKLVSFLEKKIGMVDSIKYGSTIFKKIQNILYIKALPYFEETDNSGKSRKKSCTAETIWSLSIIKEALSPEIGWIFIDTLTSKEWVERRAKNKRGFPHRVEEIESMRDYDPEAYKIFQDITNNNKNIENNYRAKSKLINLKREDKDFETDLETFLNGKHSKRDIGDILESIKEDKSKIEIFNTFKQIKGVISEIEPKRGENSDFEQSKGENSENNQRSRISELSNFEKDFTPRSKIQANRPFFHRVESILHEEIVKLFSPEGRKKWYTVLHGESDVDINDSQLIIKLKEKQEELISQTLDRMHDRLIFDLLTTPTIPKELQKAWDSLE